MIDTFTKVQFEEAIPYTFECMGLVQGEYTYKLKFANNPWCFIELRSSIGSNGISHGDGEDSIRAWLIGEDGRPAGKSKINCYVTRRPGWEGRMATMLDTLARIGKHINPCPICQRILVPAVKGDKVYIFCPTDSDERNNKNHERHVSLMVLDKTGNKVAAPVIAPVEKVCPTCKMPLRKVEIRKGANAGKFALTCPAQENGKYLNHYFEVLP